MFFVAGARGFFGPPPRSSKGAKCGRCSETVSRQSVELESGARLPSPTPMERDIQTDRMDVLTKLPQVRTNKECVIPDGQNIIIDDLGTNAEWRNAFRNMITNEVVFLEPVMLSNLVSETLKQTELSTNSKVAIIYPKQGGLSVKRTELIKNTLINTNLFEFDVDSFREKPNTRPIINMPTKLIRIIKDRLIDTIVVVDDVIITGITLKTMQEKIYSDTDVVEENDYNQDLRFGWSSIKTKRIPLKWYAISWLMYGRPKIQESNLEKYSGITTGIYYRGEKGQTPVNSLSTWVYDERKGRIVLNLYAQKYASNPEYFIDFITKMKGGTK